MLRNRIDIISVLVVFVVTIFRIYFVLSGQEFSLVFFLLTLLGISSVWSIKHNYIHAAIFTNKKINSLFGKVLSVNTGTPVINTVIVHIVTHHQHNNDEHDWTSVNYAKPFKWKLMTMLIYPFIVLPELIKGKKEHLKNTKSDNLKRQIFFDNLLIFSTLILAFAWSPISAFWYVLIPIIYGQWFLVALNYMQHQGCDHDSQFDHSINYTGRLYNLLLFNVGYHTAHHEFPNEHWSKLPQIHRKNITPNINPDLEKSNFLRSLVFDYILKFE